jgi:tetratricopeptide (TPR) repeat protein
MRKIFVFLLALFAFYAVDAQNELIEKGDKQMELNNFPAAIQTFGKALKAAPNSSTILIKLADANARLGNNKEVENLLSKAANMAKADPIAALKYGKILIRNGNYTEAKKWFANYAKSNAAEGQHFIESCDFALENATLPSLYKVENAGIINSQFDEFGASLIGGKLVYSSGRMDMQRKTSKMPVGANQLFTSDLASGKPSSNGFFRADLKSSYNDGPIAVSADEKTVVITHNNIINGLGALQQNGLELSLTVADLNKSGDWSDAKPFTQNQVGFSTGFACLNANGTTLYFSSDRPGGQGGFDIYKSEKTDNGWSAAVNLGDAINTSGNEITPFLDGQNLFFSSDYHQGFGGYDVFRAEKTGADWKTIYHLGTAVNTSADDYNFIFKASENIGFLTSNREGSKGGTDIYTVGKDANEITITVKDADNQAIANAKIDFSKCGEAAFMTDANGKYSLQTTSNFVCEAEISKDGFGKTTANIIAGKGTYSVVLKKDIPPYTGILNDTKSNAIEGVTVKATNKTTKEILETVTLSNGEYSLPLTENATYDLSFSRPGFVNLQTRNIKTGNGSKRDILGKNTLMDIGEALPVESGFATKGVSIKEIKKGFAVQIASVTGEKVDMSAYDKIKSVGGIYTTFANATSKVKVGTFEKREDAVAALAKVKEQGFIQAFIVEEGKIAVQPKEMEKKEVQKIVPKTPLSDYKVRIVTLKDASKFDKKALSAVGKVDEMKSGENTVIVLTDFATLDAAKLAKEKAIGLGFKDAFVVQPKDGKLIKVD